MKKFITFCLLLQAQGLFAQEILVRECKAGALLFTDTVRAGSKLCNRPNASHADLLVFCNGILQSESFLEALDPGMVESLFMVKAAENKLGCRPGGDVVVITAKNPGVKTMIVRDRQTGEALSDASILWDGTYALTDDRGSAAVKLSPGRSTTIYISFIGYHPYKAEVDESSYKDSSVIFLKRNSGLLKPLVISTGIISSKAFLKQVCGNTWPGETITINREKVDEGAVSHSPEMTSVRLYPNPVARKSSVRVSVPGSEDAYEVQLVNAAGQRVGSERFSAAAGPFTLKLPAVDAGVYLVRILHLKSGRQKTSRLVIQ